MSTVVSLICLGSSFQKMTHYYLLDGSLRPSNLEKNLKPWTHQKPSNRGSQGFRFFFKIGWPKWPMEQKMVGYFLKLWAQAYQTNHSWHSGSLLYLNIDTDTCMRPLKKEDQLSLNEGQKYCRMLQGEHSAMLLTFNKLPFVIKIFLFCLFWVAVLLHWLPTCTFCFVELVEFFY